MDSKKYFSVAVRDSIRGLLGMSRVLIAVLVITQASIGAILALRHLPPVKTIIIGFLACLTGAAALIGFNDLLDIKIDQARLKYNQKRHFFDMGSLFIHHPVAKGVISFRTGVIWVISLGLLSLTLTYLLKPWLPPILLIIGFFVALYSYLSTRTPFKIVAVSTAVVLGGAAGWLAVAPPDLKLFPLFTLWTLVWEIGGRNIPNDLNDINEDSQLGLKTIPIVYGKKKAGLISFIFLLLSVLISIPVVFVARFSAIVGIIAVALGIYFLLIPGYRLLKNPVPEVSARLFNYACLYPLSVLIIFMLNAAFV